MVRIVALLVLTALAAMPAAALGAPAQQQSPFQQPAPVPTPEPAVEPTTPTPAPTTQTDDADGGSLGTRDALLVAVGIAALIGGIWFVIARDAKRATAGRVRTADSALGDGRGGSATRSARRNRRLSADERKRRKRGRAR